MREYIPASAPEDPEVEPGIIYISLASHTLQSQEKEGVVTMRTAQNAIITEKVTGNHKQRKADSICACTASKVLPSNKFKSQV